MIIKKNMNINMEVTPEIVIEFFKEAKYEDVVEVYKGMPEITKAVIASKHLYDLASNDPVGYENFIGVSAPKYEETVKKTVEPKRQNADVETKKPDVETKNNTDTETQHKRTSKYDYKVGDVYTSGSVQFAITKITDNYVYTYTMSTVKSSGNAMLDALRSIISANQVFRKDAFSSLIKSGLIKKVDLADK